MLNYIVWSVRPEIFTLPEDLWLIGGFSVRWYGLLFAFAFIFGYIIMQKIFNKEGVPIKVLDELTTTMVISVIVGARLGHCLFYEPAYYLSNPIEILKIWEGGLASHGASIGILIGLYIFSRKNHKPYIWIMDRIVIVVALGGGLVRLGNLMNSEIFGDITTMPWGFVFENYYDAFYATDPRHPTQLYEALGYFTIFLITGWIYKKHDGHPRPGQMFGIFLILLFGSRFFIEFIKIPQVGFEEQMTLNMGQWLSIPFILAGILILLWSRKQKEQKL
ncbi:MAG: prolipoprotein diacylglyceryl transferase [Bacteroidetes bacterium]|nr:MAG: prolipoprotein diacylglyceryl transferase [Bacteroidota bacterium]